MYIVTGNAGQSSSGKWRNCGWDAMTAACKATFLIFAVLVSAPDALAVGGSAVSAQCWVNGILQGGFPLDRPCPGTTGGGGTVFIMGPPVIVWRHPSAEGSQMPGLSPVDNRLANQLNSIADTAITLRQKGEFAMRNGDYAKAKLYFDEARRRDPDDPELQEDFDKLRGLFDNGTQSLTVPRLQLPKQEFLKPVPDEKVSKYMTNPEVKKLREAEIITYNKLANADAELNTVTESENKGTASKSDVDQAQTTLNKAVENFQQAHKKLEEKIYVLD
ncbi:MAG: tetratricopeptide repeat protein [Smithella sp.]